MPRVIMRDMVNAIVVLVYCIHRIASDEILPKQEFDYEYRLPDVLTPVIYDLKFTFASNSDEIIGQVLRDFRSKNNSRISLGPNRDPMQNWHIVNRAQFKSTLPNYTRRSRI